MTEDRKDILKAIGIMALSFLVLVGTVAYSNANELKSQIVEPVVKINDNCSAVHVDIPMKGDFYLTAKHCVDDVTEGYLSIERRDGVKLLESKNVYFDVERKSSNRDLALLRMRENSSFPKVTIAEETLVDEGDDVWAVGYPLGWTRTVTNGLYNGSQVLTQKETGLKEDIEFTRSSPPIAGGNSGGGLFQKNSKTNQYELIGITSMGVRGYSHISLWVPLKDIRYFLNLGTTNIKSSFTNIDNR